MAEARLILYCDNDFIVPVVDKGDGYYDAFRGTADGCLWLYFYTPADNSAIEYGHTFKAPYCSGRPGYLGDIWKAIDNDLRYSTPVLDSLPYITLLDNAGIVRELRQFYSAGGTRREVNIPTCYVFAGNISYKARKEFIAHLQEQSFDTVSYSVAVETLALAYTRRVRPELKPEFGQKTVFFESSGGDMLMRCYAFDGSTFLPLEEERTLNGMGENPLRTALVKIVLSIMQRTHNFLRQEDIPRETAYQMQFVDDWLRQRRDPSFGITFHYSSDPDTRYPCIVDNTQLNTIRDTAVAEIVRQMAAYRNNVARNDMLQCILLGEAFEDEDFVQRCIANIGSNQLVTVIRPDKLPELLSLYSTVAPLNQVERLDDFDRIRNTQAQERRAIGAWISNAERIRALAARTSALADRISEDGRQYSRCVEDAVKNVDRVLAQSGGKFDAALEEWRRCRPNTNPREEYNSEIGAYRTELDACRSIFAETDKFEGARTIIDRIIDGANTINNSYAKCSESETNYNALESLIEDYRQKYPRYSELLRQFRHEGNVSVKRRLLKQIQDEQLTREELPVVELDELIPLRLTASVEKVKTGLFRSKKVLKVRAELPDGNALPCNSVLLIQDKPLASIQDRYIRAEYDRGESGPFEFSSDLPLPQCDGAARLRVYFKPHPDEAIGINNAFDCNECKVEL